MKHKKRPRRGTLFELGLRLVGNEGCYQNLAAARTVTELYNALQNFKPRAKGEARRVPAQRLSPARRALDIDKLVAGYEAGWSLRQLADNNGICRETVTLQLRKVGVAIRLRGSNVRAH